jgi:hypothetical protein
MYAALRAAALKEEAVSGGRLLFGHRMQQVAVDMPICSCKTCKHSSILIICCVLLSLCMFCVLLVDDRSPRQYQHVKIYIFCLIHFLLKFSVVACLCVSTIIYTHMLVDSSPLCTHMNAYMIILPTETCSIQHCSTKGAY